MSVTPTNLTSPRAGPARKFERNFMQRTLRILQEYTGPYDATLLLNCLLGLLIVPREALIDQIDREPFTSFNSWGITPSCVRNFGAPTRNNPQPQTLRGVVRSLRDAVAHFHVRPIQGGGQVTGFVFRTQTGFEAAIPLGELRAFVEHLATHVQRQSVPRRPG